MEDFNLKNLLRQILSKFYIIIISLVIVVLAGEFYTLKLQTPLYQSNTQLVLTSEANSNAALTVNDVTLSNNLVTTYSQIVVSHNVLSQVIEHLNLNTSPDALKGKITVTPTKSTQLITVKVLDADPATAQSIANDLGTTFKAEIERLYKIDNVQIVDPASYSETPANLNVAKQTALYVLIGFALGVGIILALTYLDTTIKSSKTVEDDLGLTVLGVVPNMEKK